VRVHDVTCLAGQTYLEPHPKELMLRNHVLPVDPFAHSCGWPKAESESSALSVANLEACLSRAHGFTVTVLLWHGMTTALVVAALAHVGRGLMAWRTPATRLNDEPDRNRRPDDRDRPRRIGACGGDARQ
jgi:hypothetical protein